MSETNILREIEDENIIIKNCPVYSGISKQKYLEAFQDFVDRKKISGCYSDEIWKCDNSIKKFTIHFEFSRFQYEHHFGEESGISFYEIKEMLRAYALSLCGGFIFATVRTKLKAVIQFITTIGEQEYAINTGEFIGIEDFLVFIGIPYSEILKFKKRIHFKAEKKPDKRELANLVNYLAIDSEISEMFSLPLTNEEFVTWFPVYFWTKITFLLPLRPTEMLVTPFDCICIRNGETWLTVRRTQLKKGRRKVYYDVDKDFRLFEYDLPLQPATIDIIKKYQALTSRHPRRFLFDFSFCMTNAIFSLQAFNIRLAEFIGTHLIGNHRYDFARYAAGVKEFEVVTAGDSRPIAMANLYFQNVGAEVCRQLADHTNINTSANYYMNVEKTVYAASIMQLQKRYQKDAGDLYDLETFYEKGAELPECVENHCVSSHRPFETGDITDCVMQDHLQECVGCYFCRLSIKEYQNTIEERKSELNNSNREVLRCLAKPDNKRENYEQIFLRVHTDIVRYKTVCDGQVKEKLKEWRRYQNTKTIC